MTIDQTEETTDFHTERAPQSQETYLYFALIFGSLFVLFGVLCVVIWCYCKHRRMKLCEINKNADNSELLSTVIRTVRDEFFGELPSVPSSVYWSGSEEADVDGMRTSEDYSGYLEDELTTEMNVLNRRSE